MAETSIFDTPTQEKPSIFDTPAQKRPSIFDASPQDRPSIFDRPSRELEVKPVAPIAENLPEITPQGISPTAPPEEVKGIQEELAKKQAQGGLKGNIIGLGTMGALDIAQIASHPVQTLAGLTGIPSAYRVVTSPIQEYKKGQLFADIAGATPLLGAGMALKSAMRPGIPEVSAPPEVSYPKEIPMPKELVRPPETRIEAEKVLYTDIESKFNKLKEAIGPEFIKHPQTNEPITNLKQTPEVGSIGANTDSIISNKMMKVKEGIRGINIIGQDLFGTARALLGDEVVAPVAKVNYVTIPQEMQRVWDSLGVTEAEKTLNSLPKATTYRIGAVKDGLIDASALTPAEQRLLEPYQRLSRYAADYFNIPEEKMQADYLFRFWEKRVNQVPEGTINRIANFMKIDPEAMDVRDMLADFRKFRSGKEGYSFDIVKSARYQWRQGLKEKYLEPTLEEIKPKWDNIPAEYDTVKKLWWREAQGYPSITSQFLQSLGTEQFNVDKFVRNYTKGTYAEAIGAAVDTATIHIPQLLNTLAERGIVPTLRAFSPMTKDLYDMAATTLREMSLKKGLEASHIARNQQIMQTFGDYLKMEESLHDEYSKGFIDKVMDKTAVPLHAFINTALYAIRGLDHYANVIANMSEGMSLKDAWKTAIDRHLVSAGRFGALEDNPIIRAMPAPLRMFHVPVWNQLNIFAHWIKRDYGGIGEALNEMVDNGHISPETQKTVFQQLKNIPSSPMFKYAMYTGLLMYGMENTKIGRKINPLHVTLGALKYYMAPGFMEGYKMADAVMRGDYATAAKYGTSIGIKGTLGVPLINPQAKYGKIFSGQAPLYEAVPIRGIRDILATMAGRKTPEQLLGAVPKK